MTKAYNDFLGQEHFDYVHDLFMTEKLPWHFNSQVVTTRKDFMFVHGFMEDGKVISPQFFAPVQAMLAPIGEKRAFIGVSRIKANLYTNQGEAIEHPKHHDIPLDSGVADKFFVAVYHVNTCNGKTVVGNEEYVSKENQLVIFDNVEHYGSVQTDTDTRVVINFTLRER